LTIVYRVLYTTRMNTIFGEYIREKREALRQSDRSYSLRQVAGRIGVEPSYLSKIERGEHQAYLIEGKIKALANELTQLIRELKDMPDHAVLRIVREVRDGNW